MEEYILRFIFAAMCARALTTDACCPLPEESTAFARVIRRDGYSVEGYVLGMKSAGAAVASLKARVAALRVGGLSAAPSSAAAPLQAVASSSKQQSR